MLDSAEIPSEHPDVAESDLCEYYSAKENDCLLVSDYYATEKLYGKTVPDEMKEICVSKAALWNYMFDNGFMHVNLIFNETTQESDQMVGVKKISSENAGDGGLHS